ncbi:class I SAM-dependent methyltransferase [Actinomadura sp. KC06]|uniref:class I SAM-dependent methyltransferase n=1 Tax=Actinomadura sp. KC06 TaxID=2530369 RepID=UPI00105220CB|nr:class I SAM-dependent methyltransferase [Actinomadura sp. KC06]TDD37561.1 class I SAM-dependent methyltransferase [Actinomadura sp. KC06]
MFGADMAEVYEFIYRARGKDWEAEADELTRLIKSRKPTAHSLLDVACGTGAHLAALRKSFPDTAGVEISEPMLMRARERLPGVSIHQADMRDFRLGRTFDVVTCLFTAIGYVPTVADLRSSVACMADHLVPGGVLCIEPWWFPERFIEGYVAGDVAREDGRIVARVSRSTREGAATRMELRFIVADSAGLREFTEIDRISLFTEQEYLDAFARADCKAEYLDGMLTERGLFIGRRRA